jgi:aspartate racemase
MKTIGVLGGITWHSAAEYYRLLNAEVNTRTEDEHAARCVLLSVDLGAIEPLMQAQRWDEAAHLLSADARRVEAAGAEVFLLACNTMHVGWERIAGGLSIPAIHVVDATADALDGHGTVALLGTPWTMELPFFRERLEARGFEVTIPEADDRAEIGRTIHEELSFGRVVDRTRSWYVELIERLDTEAVILGCSELGLLLSQDDVDVPLVDTVRAHVGAAVDYAM